MECNCKSEKITTRGLIKLSSLDGIGNKDIARSFGININPLIKMWFFGGEIHSKKYFKESDIMEIFLQKDIINIREEGLEKIIKLIYRHEPLCVGLFPRYQDKRGNISYRDEMYNTLDTGCSFMHVKIVLGG